MLNKIYLWVKRLWLYRVFEKVWCFFKKIPIIGIPLKVFSFFWKLFKKGLCFVLKWIRKFLHLGEGISNKIGNLFDGAARLIE